jgi:predicted  nucleic acid-binding Zn-ribbon protein
MMEDPTEYELLALQIKSLATPYLPAFSFVVGILLTYGVLRFLPSYNDTCASINECLNAPPSVVDLLNHKTTPGEFPIPPAEKLIHHLEEQLLTKNNEIASLRKDLEGEDEELAELLAEKDDLLEQQKKELASSQAALKEKEKKILTLTAEANRRARKAPKFTRDKRTGILIRDDSPAQLMRNSPPEKPMHDGLPARPQSKLFKVFNGELDTLKNEVRTLKSQLEESGNASTSAMNSLKINLNIKHKKQISDLEAQLARRQQDGASAEKSLLQRDRQIKELEQKLSQPHLDTERIGKALAERDHQIHELQQRLSQYQQQLSQHRIHTENVEGSLVKRDQELKDLQESSQKIFDFNHGRINELETQLSQRQLVTSNVQDLAAAQRVAELKAQLSQRNTDVDNARNLVHQLQQQVSHLQRVSHLQAQDSATAQRVAELEAQLSECNSDVNTTRNLVRQLEQQLRHVQDQAEQSKSYAQQSISTAGIQIADLMQQLTDCKVELASAQETITDLKGKWETDQLDFAHFHQDHDALEEKHKSLEERHNACEAQLKMAQSRLADADKLYVQYVDLCNNWKHAQSVQASVIDEGVERAMACVAWQLKGRTAEETEQKCKEMGDRLAGRVKPILDMIRGQMGKREEAPGKRKREEEEVVEEEAGRGGKRQHKE